MESPKILMPKNLIL